MRRCSGSKSHVVPKSVAPVWAFRQPLLHQKGSSYSVVAGLKETLPTNIAIVAKRIIRQRIRRVFPPSLGTVEQIYRHQLALTSRSPFRLSQRICRSFLREHHTRALGGCLCHLNPWNPDLPGVPTTQKLACCSDVRRRLSGKSRTLKMHMSRTEQGLDWSRGIPTGSCLLVPAQRSSHHRCVSLMQARTVVNKHIGESRCSWLGRAETRP